MNTSFLLTADRFPLVRDIGWNRTDQLYTHPDRILDYDVFLYVSQGAMHVIEEGCSYTVGEREYMFLEKGRHHWGLPDTPAGTAWYWIHFANRIDAHIEYKEKAPLPEPEYFAPEHYEHHVAIPKHGQAPPGTEERLSSLLKESSQWTSQRMTRLSISVYQFLLDFHALTFTSDSRHRSASRLVEQVMNYLSAHVDQPFDANHLGQQLNMNYSYISAAFSKASGQSIVETHTRLKMNKAVELMRSSESLTIAQISERLGYQNPFYFTRVFKKTFGEPPSSFLRQIYKT
ncbi:helix-turn-helix transcriptional regulator [Paenibacillus sp. JDR-2]|uniref:helix-turn-helix transcriptional regulator n=1 Tax=Paenibacillus sp. (strain JDR-2) TaxID=324057 RepID=UPI000166A65C|nr:AraC family transcriptional regulator [Paenibacillus sp. JDR-2]ACT00643.1 transcriptional regulator, AraC family [Paenibacillus sp. JDR-2]